MTNNDLVGDYPIKVTLIDSSGLSTKYSFNLEITGGELPVEKKNKTDQLELCQASEGFTAPNFKIVSVSVIGLVKVEWSKEMIKPNYWENLTMNAENSALEFNVLIFTESESGIQFNWWLKDFDPHFFTFQLNFTDPFKVSYAAILDRVQLTMVNCRSWVDSDGVTIPLGYVDQKDIPP